VINLPTVGYSEFYRRRGTQSGASRKSGGAERSGAVSGVAEKRTLEQSGARSGRLRSGNGAESGGYINRLEREAAFSPLTCSANEQKSSRYAASVLPGNGMRRISVDIYEALSTLCIMMTA